MNIELLKEVTRQIKAHPEAYDQDISGEIRPGCGTRCCIAGMAVLLEDPITFNRWATEDNGTDIYNYARKLLKLSKRQACALFDPAAVWPEPFARKYAEADDDEGRAAVGARRIAYFIKTGE